MLHRPRNAWRGRLGGLQDNSHERGVASSQIQARIGQRDVLQRNGVDRAVRFKGWIRYRNAITESRTIRRAAFNTRGGLSIATSVRTTVGGCASDILNHYNAWCALIDNQVRLAGGGATKLIRHRQFV